MVRKTLKYLGLALVGWFVALPAIGALIDRLPEPYHNPVENRGDGSVS